MLHKELKKFNNKIQSLCNIWILNDNPVVSLISILFHYTTTIRHLPENSKQQQQQQ